MTHTDKGNSGGGGGGGGAYTYGGISIYPGHCLFEIPRGQAAPVLAAAGFIKQYDSGNIQTVLVELVPSSAAYNLVKAP